MPPASLATTGRGERPDRNVATRRPSVNNRRRARRSLPKWIQVTVLLAPAAVLYSIFVLSPIIRSFYYSLFEWNGLEPLSNFVGLANYRRALDDGDLLLAMRNNGLLIVLSLGLQIPFALMLSLALNRKFKGRAVFRLVFFAPFVLSEVIAGVLFLLLLQPGSVVDQTFDLAGLGDATPLWLADRDVVMFTLFFVLSWKYFGFSMILLLAGLRGIPEEINEAAAIDGATGRRLTRHITLPLLGPTIRIVAFLAIIGSLQTFDIVYVMTQGGPSGASNTMAHFMIDQAFKRFEFGYGSAVAVIITMLALGLSLAYQRYVLRRDMEGAVTGART